MRSTKKYQLVKGFPAYRVSNTGEVQSRWKMGAYHSEFVIKVRDVWKDVSLHLDPDKGYYTVNLRDGYGKGKTTLVHFLVAQAFIGPRPKGRIIRHLDGNPLNNNVSNLAYGTYKDNENDKHTCGTWFSRYVGSKLTYAQVLEIREKAKNKVKQTVLATEYNVSRPTITRIVNNSIWNNEGLSGI